MSTRGLYTFIDDNSSWNVYKHSDNYPEGAARTLQMALTLFAWKLPRFESDEFAAAFIAAGKMHSWINTKKDLDVWWRSYGPKGTCRQYGGGGVRLMPQGDPALVAQKHCSDIEYRYEIKMAVALPTAIENSAKKQPNEPVLWIKAIAGRWWHEDDPDSSTNGEEVIFNGPFTEFVEWAEKKEQAA